jgi:hypothetical protein
MKIMSFSAFKLKNIVKAVCFTLGVSTLFACVGGDENGDTTSGDLTPPVITLTGPAEVTIESFESGIPYMETGATAYDFIDGPVSLQPVGIDEVDTSVLGEYIITFHAVDNDGNAAEPVTRTVTVVQAIDRTAPVITLVGDAEITFTKDGDDYYIEGDNGGATALDDFESYTGSGEVPVIVSGDVVENDEAGVYTITYTATDSAGNTSTLDRIVTVIGDPSEPVLTLRGEKTITHVVGRPYREFGATAIDLEDGNMTVPAPTGTVDHATPGTYMLSYSVTDTQGKTVSTDRTVEIITAENARPFIFTVDTSISTDNAGLADGDLTGSNAFYLSNNNGSYTYDFNIDWGDGNVETNVTDPAITHFYDVPGTYTISISGDFHQFYTTDITKVVSIQQWGDIEWSTFQNSFTDSAAFLEWPTDIPDVTRAYEDPSTAANGIFRRFMLRSTANPDISLWDMTGQANFIAAFNNATNFNQPLDMWDTSSLTHARHMFLNAVSFDQPLPSWDMSRLTTANGTSQNTFNNIGTSVANWDATLVGWAEQNKVSGARINANANFHSEVGAAAIATLEALGWTINDAGLYVE